MRASQKGERGPHIALMTALKRRGATVLAGFAVVVVAAWHALAWLLSWYR